MSMCNFISAKGQKCKIRSLECSNFCHKVSHYIDKDDYEKVTKAIINNFEKNTKVFDKSSIIDVISDGACLYYCMGIYLLKNSKDILKKINTSCYITRNSDIISILDKCKDSNFSFSKINTDDLVNIAENIQYILAKWIYDNKDRIFGETGITISDLVFNCHELTIEQYKEYYSVFAGDNDYIEIDGKTIHIPDRWGSTPELYAFSVLFNVNINIYCLYRLQNFNIIECTIRSKNCKFKLSSSFNETSELPKFNLVRSKKRGDYHYQYLNI